METLKPKSPVKYQILTDWHSVNAISAEWDALLEQSSCNRAFSCSKWFLAAFEIFPQLKCLVLVARRDGVLAGIMPLVLDIDNRTAGFSRNWSDYHDIIVREGDIKAAAGLLDLAVRGAGDYDKVLLKRIRLDSNCLQAAQHLHSDWNSPKELFVSEKVVKYAYADLTCGYDVYRKKILSKKFRHNLRTIRNNATRRGIVAGELRPEEWEPEQITRIFLSVHSTRFGDQTALRSSISFIEKLFPPLFADGRMRVFALLSEGRAVGMHVGMVGKNSIFGWNGGFLPEVQGLSPGNLVLEEAVRQACLSGFDEYDFGWGDQEYKDRWTTNIREVGELEYKVSNEMGPAGLVVRSPVGSPGTGAVRSSMI